MATRQRIRQPLPSLGQIMNGEYSHLTPTVVAVEISGSLTLKAKHQNAPMSKITNDGLTRSGTGCFIPVPVWQQWASKG